MIFPQAIERYIWVALGGGIGAVLRYGVSGWVQKFSGGSFPFGTLGVNIIGSFLIGTIMALSMRALWVTPALRIFLVTGLLGGFTTFSAFSYETLSLIQDGETVYALANILGSLTSCLVAVWLGTVIGRMV